MLTQIKQASPVTVAYFLSIGAIMIAFSFLSVYVNITLSMSEASDPLVHLPAELTIVSIVLGSVLLGCGLSGFFSTS